MMSHDEILDIVFTIDDKLQYEVNEDGIVTVLQKQNHWMQKFFRKLKVKIPMYKKVSFDKYGSYVFLEIDGKKTVKEIGASLERKYGIDTHPLYERLLLFLNHIEVNCKYINKLI